MLGAIAILGAINTGYITVTKLVNAPTVCPTGGCEQVLSSPYATLFGLPLSLYGLVAYIGMATLALAPLAVNPEKNKPLRTTLENWTWLLLFAGATAMLVFSGYLMNIMFSKFVAVYGANGICYFCLASATFALSLFVITLLGRSWEDVGQLFFVGIVVAVITLVGTLGVYAPIEAAQTQSASSGQVGLPVQNESGPAEIQLAQHLKQVGAKMYGAYTCPHCYEQKELFGKQAAAQINYIECHPQGKNSQTELCKAANLEGFPTWDIKGQRLVGRQTLEQLANASGYTGSRDFRSR
jgi:uncharacterized membrane protein